MAQTSHSVYFLDSGGHLICEPMLVREGGSAPPPAYQPPAGHIFLCWSCSTSHVTEDIFCVALTQQKAQREHVVTFYDSAGQVLDVRAAGDDAPTPDFTPPEGLRLLGWDVKFDSKYDTRPDIKTDSHDAKPGEGESVFVPVGKPMPRVLRDCRVYPRCEPAACRMFVLDLRAAAPRLLPLGSFGCGAHISREDLACLHLRARQTLRPFRFTINGDTILALTQQGVRAFGMDMWPIEMHAIRLMPTYEPPANFLSLQQAADEAVRVSA